MGARAEVGLNKRIRIGSGFDSRRYDRFWIGLKVLFKGKDTSKYFVGNHSIVLAKAASICSKLLLKGIPGGKERTALLYEDYPVNEV